MHFPLPEGLILFLIDLVMIKIMVMNGFEVEIRFYLAFTWNPNLGFVPNYFPNSNPIKSHPIVFK